MSKRAYAIIRVFPKIDNSGNIARIELVLKIVGKILTKL